VLKGSLSCRIALPKCSPQVPLLDGRNFPFLRANPFRSWLF
jgi:hypothetical protein